MSVICARLCDMRKRVGSIMSVEEALVGCLDQEHDEVEPSVEVAADAASLKVISTNMWKLGPITQGKALDMVRGLAVRQHRLATTTLQ